MKKLLFLIAIALCCRFATFAQATSLTVDCQTPGWLSSKINYGDQLTVENLTITGYLNSDDLHFIGSLMENSDRPHVHKRVFGRCHIRLSKRCASGRPLSSNVG